MADAPSRRARYRALRRTGAFGRLSLLTLVLYLVALPTLGVLWTSLTDGPLGTTTAFDLGNYRVALGDPQLRSALRGTVVFAGGSTLLAVALGTYLAWVTERTATRARSALYVLALVPLIVPGLLTTISWTLVLRERTGIANHFLTAWFGVGVPLFDAHTMTAMIWVEGTDGITVPFLLMGAAFRAFDPSLEEASRTSGADPRRTLLRVTLPLLAPALLTAAMLTLVRSIGAFAVPATMGLPGGIRVLATQVYLASRTFPSNANLAATYAVLHLAIALVVLVLYQRTVGDGGRFVTVSGRGARSGRPATRRPGPHGPIAVALLGIVVVVPLAVMTYISLLPYYGPVADNTPDRFTLDAYTYVLTTGFIRRALVNNLAVGGIAALATVLLAALIAWYALRSPGRTGRALDALATVPIALPGSVLGLAILVWYLALPLPIYGTIWVLGIGYVTAFLPFGARTAHAALQQLDVSLEDASRASGATRAQTFVRVILPLLSPALVAAAVFVLARSLKVLALPALLASPGTEVLPVVVYSLYERGAFPELNALGVLLTTGLALLVLPARALARRASRPADRDEAAGPTARSSTSKEPAPSALEEVAR
jgi:iron(III) transport system permease protein